MIGALELAGELLGVALAAVAIAAFVLLALGGALDVDDNLRGLNGGAYERAGESAPAPAPSSPVNPHLPRFYKRLWEAEPTPPTWRDRLRCLVRGHDHHRWRPNHRMRKHMARRFRLKRWPDEHSFPMGPCQRCGREA